jgi:hypothetical protein
MTFLLVASDRLVGAVAALKWVHGGVLRLNSSRRFRPAIGSPVDFLPRRPAAVLQHIPAQGIWGYGFARHTPSSPVSSVPLAMAITSCISWRSTYRMASNPPWKSASPPPMMAMAMAMASGQVM